MSWWARWVRRDDRDQDLADEIRFHLQQETRLRVDRGLDSDCFAVASFNVARRRYELGVRAALGASGGQLRRLVISDALRPVGAGLILGLVGAYWAAQFAQTLVYHTDARDPWTLGLVAMVLLGTAVLAVLLPARRASRVDPCVVLRTP